MWKWGKEYLQLGLEPDSDRPSWFGVVGIIVASVFLFFGSAFASSLLFHLFPADIGRTYAESRFFYFGIIRFSCTAVAFLPVLLFLRRTLNCSFAEVFFGKRRCNAVWFFAWIAVTWTVLTMGQICVGGKIQWYFPSPPQIVLFVPLALAILFQSMAEELAFRGYFSKAVYLLGRSLISVFVIVPIVFFLYHQQFNFASFLVYSGTGVFYSYLSLRTGGLQLSTAAHFANNSFAVLAGNWIVQTHQPNLVLLEIVEMVVMALLLEAALRLSKLGRQSADDVSAAGGK